MYVLAKNIIAHDVSSDDRTIPKGTRLSDVYELPWGGFTALAHIWGQRIKLQLAKADFEIEKNRS